MNHNLTQEEQLLVTRTWMTLLEQGFVSHHFNISTTGADADLDFVLGDLHLPVTLSLKPNNDLPAPLEAGFLPIDYFTKTDGYDEFYAVDLGELEGLTTHLMVFLQKMISFGHSLRIGAIANKEDKEHSYFKLEIIIHWCERWRIVLQWKNPSWLDYNLPPCKAYDAFRLQNWPEGHPGLMRDED